MTLREESGFVCCHHDVFPEFTLTAASAERHMDCNQEWTRGEIATGDNHAAWFELRCHQTLLRRIHYVSFDNHKKSMVAPDWVPIGTGRFYFYRAGSVDHSVQRFWAERHSEDDSKGLLIRGQTQSACKARLRWPSGLSIPVVEPGELERFLEGGQSRAIGGPDPSTDPVEQYELFICNLLEFDDFQMPIRPVPAPYNRVDLRSCDRRYARTKFEWR